MDAVPLDRAVLGDSQEEAVELLEALGHPRHPPLADPGRLRARSNCSVRALVVLAYELPDGSVQAGQLQGGHGMMMPGVRCPGRVASTSVLTVWKNRSILPLPWGRPTVEWMMRIFKAIAVYSRW